jgi:large subunit ribosomal protein L9
MQNQLLLIEDVESLGRCGDIVSVKPGYARNFLLPKKKALVATKGALNLRAKLVEKRQKQAEEDRKVAEALSSQITGMQLSTIVKVDPEGNMYGSVNASDIVALFAQQGITLDKKSVVLAHPIKELGDYTLELRLKEGVGAAYTLSIVADHPVARFVEEKGSEAVEA